MSQQGFDGVIGRGKGAGAYLPVPFDPNPIWGVRPRHHISGMVNGKRFRGVIEAAEDGSYQIAMGPMWLTDCGLTLGEAFHAVISLEGPQRDGLDPDIAAALAAEPAAAAFWDVLAQFYRKAYLRWIDGTKKKPDLRAARIAATVTLLKAGKKQRPSE